MRVARRTAVVVVCVLAGLLAAGCARAPAGPPRASVQSCTEYGVYAIQHHITVKWQPAACHGLTKAELNFAVGRAIFAVAGRGRDKAAWRARARIAGERLAHLVTAVPRPSAPAQPVAAPAAPPAAPAHGGGATGLAALIAWLVTVASGGYMLARWIAHGGLRRRRGGLHPGVILTHFGMATAGLAAWIVYLVTNFAVPAWTAVGLLLPVMGLGIVLVTLSAPARFAGVSATGSGPAPDAGAMAVSPGGSAVAAVSPATVRTARRGVPIPVIALHGTAAAVTILLALLAALSAR